MNRFNVSAWAVKHPAFVLYLILAVAAAGLHAYLQMGRAEDPTFTIKTMVVTASWPGATADEVQRQVAEPIEKKLQELPHFDYTKTFTRPGLAVIQLNLKDTVPGVEVTAWHGMMAPAGTPPAIIAKLEQAMMAYLRTPAAEAKLKEQGVVRVGDTAAEFQAFMAKELALYEGVIKEAGITAP